MPNRILRDWTDSFQVNVLSAEGERFFTRLIMKADDFGRFHAHPSLLKASLFPLRLDKIRESDIARWSAECAKAGLIALYEVSEKQFLEIRIFGQRIKDGQKSKFPDNPGFSRQIPEVPALVGVGGEVGGEVVAQVREGAVFPDPLNTEQFREKWAEWLKFRKRRKLSDLLPESIAQQLKRLAQYGEAISTEAIEQSIANSWQGLFPEKIKPRPGAKPPTAANTPDDGYTDV